MTLFSSLLFLLYVDEPRWGAILVKLEISSVERVCWGSRRETVDGVRDMEYFIMVDVGDVFGSG